MPEIATTPRFARAFADLISIERGFVNDPKDRGGPTKYGVSLRFALLDIGTKNPERLKQYDIDMDGDCDVDDIRALPLATSEAIYFRAFWQANSCGALPVPIGEMIFDQAVNGGALAARKLLQRALRKFDPALDDDGSFGLKTLTVLDIAMKARGGLPILVQAYRDAAKTRYRQIAHDDPSQVRFLKGWLARADHLGGRA